MEDNTVPECIRNVAASYGYKISQLHEYEANDYGYGAKCERYSPKYQFMQRERQKIIELKSFYIV